MGAELHFECTQCGACCKLAGLAAGMVKLPFKIKSDGSCEHLDENNKCRIYENRPDICRVEVRASAQKVMSKADYYKRTIELCKIFKNKISGK